MPVKRLLVILILVALPMGFFLWLQKDPEGFSNALEFVMKSDPIHTQGTVLKREEAIRDTERRCNRVGRRSVRCRDVAIPPRHVYLYEFQLDGIDEPFSAEVLITEENRFEPNQRISITYRNIGIPLFRKPSVEEINHL